MKILFYQHQYPAFGGIETVTTTLAARFIADGHSVRIASFQHRDGTDLLTRLPPGIWMPVTSATVQPLVEAFRPDIVIFQDSYVDIQQPLFDALEGHPTRNVDVPVLQVVLQRSLLAQLMRRGVGWAARRALRPWLDRRRLKAEAARRTAIGRHVARYVTLSSAYARAVERLAPTLRGKTAFIPNPLMPVSAPSRSSKKKRVLFVGSLNRTKAVHRLIRVWARVEGRFPDWEFVVVGDGPERGRLERLAAKTRRVRFVGFRRDPSADFAEASVFVLASEFEGWPMVLGEALWQGCVPVVSASFEAARDIVDDGVTGRVVRHFDARAFAEALCGLMADDAARARMAQTAVAKAAAFSVEAVAARWYALFADVLSAGAGPQVIAVEHSRPCGWWKGTWK